MSSIVILYIIDEKALGYRFVVVVEESKH